MAEPDDTSSVDASPETSGEYPSTDSTAGDRPASTDEAGTISEQIEKAMGRATEVIDSENQGKQEDISGKRQTGDSKSTLEQAADLTGSGSTPDNERLDTSSTGENGGTSDQAASGDSTPEKQPLTPPDSWPEDRRNEFEALPDKGKSVLMSIYRDMEKGLKKSFDTLATERKNLTDRFGLEVEQLQDLAGRVKTFQNDPVSVISQLAEEAGIDVFFNRENQEVPEFESQADLVKWLQDQSRNEARQAAADEAKKLREQRQKEEVSAKVKQEFDQAYKDHSDLPDHKEAVMKYIIRFNLPVEMAYRLATYEGLAKLAQNGQSSQAELEKTKSELEKLKKLSTMAPSLANGQGQPLNAKEGNIYEKAFASAENIISRQ